MLKPSGGFFKRMFNPDRMKKAQKKPMAGVRTAAKAVGGIFGGSPKKSLGNAMGAVRSMKSRPAPPRPVLHGNGGGVVSKAPAGSPRPVGGGGAVNRPMPRGERVRAY